MRTIWLLALTVFAGTVAGCLNLTFTLDSLFSGQGTPLEPRLLGTWAETGDDSADSWVFTAESESTYAVRIFEKGKLMGAFVGRSGRIKGALFLDLEPSWAGPDTVCRVTEEAPCDYNFILSFDVHAVLRPDLTDSSLVIRHPDAKELASHLQRRRRPLQFRLRSHDDQAELLLLSPAREVRAFLGQIADSTDVYDELYSLKRYRPRSPSSD